MDSGSRTGHYWIVWEERRGRRHLRGISRSGVVTTVLLALLAATAGILAAFTQAGTRWVGFAWAAWVLAVAAVGGRAIADAGRGFVRRSAPLRSHRSAPDEPDAQ
jgi:hypothetical protein